MSEQGGPIEWIRWVPAAILTVIVLGFVLISGRVILVPMLVSLAMAYLLSPLVAWFERRGWSHQSAVLLALVAASVGLILILIFILPGVWNQVSRSYQQAQDLLNDRTRVDPLLIKLKQMSPPVYDFISHQIEKLKDPARQEGLEKLAGEWLQSGLFRLVDLTASILDMLLIPFFVYYLLADYKLMRSHLDRLIPPRFRPVTSDLIGRVNQVLSSYVRSQLLIAIVMGTLYSIGFAAFRVPLALTIGMLSGLLNFVPYLGTLIGLGLSLTFVSLDGAGIGRIIGVLIVFIVVQSIEGYYLTPKLLGSRLHLHPLWVLCGLVIGGNLFGLLGIILAVPAIAIGKVLLAFLETIYQDSNFYRHGGISLVVPESQGLILEPFSPESHRRAIITTSELKSRIQKPDAPSEES